MTPRQKKRVERFKDLRETSLQLIIELGVDGFSMHKLADRVGLTPGALYRYYDSRDEVMVAVQCDVLDDFVDYFRETLKANESKNAVDRISALLYAFADLADTQPEKFQLIHHFSSAPEAVFDESIVGPAIEKMLELLGILSAQIEDAQNTKDLTEGDALHRTIVAWSLMQGITERRKLERFGDSFKYQELLDETVRTLLCGWGAKNWS